MKHSVFFLVLALVPIASTSCRETLDERLSRESKDFTKRYCPKQIDPNVVLDSVTYSPVSDNEKAYEYHYSVRGDSSTIETLKQYESMLREGHQKGIRNTPDLKIIRDNGIPLRYIYRLQGNKKPFMEFSFDAEDY